MYKRIRKAWCDKMDRRRLNVRTSVRNVSRSRVEGRTPPRSNPIVEGRTPQRTYISGRTPEKLKNVGD